MKEKKVKDKIYYYLLFREGDRIITKYLGKSEETLILIKEQLVRRKQLEHMLKNHKIYLNFFLKSVALSLTNHLISKRGSIINEPLFFYFTFFIVKK